jgi:hypothetical protein
MNVLDLDAALPGAWLEFDDIQHSGGYLVVRGALEQAQASHRLFGYVERRSFALTFRYVSRFEARAEAGLAGLAVSRVVYDAPPGCFRIHGRAGGSLTVWTPSTNAFLEVDAEPRQVKRFGRWRKVASRH